jgi:hypothetical protein
MRELEADTNAIWQRRRELLDSIEAIASGLLDLAKTATDRLPAQPKDETVNSDTGGDTEPPMVATDEATRLMPTLGSRRSTSASDKTADNSTSRRRKG